MVVIIKIKMFPIIGGKWKTIIGLLLLFLFTFSSSSFSSSVERNSLPIQLLKKINYQIEIKNYLGAKQLAENLWKNSSNKKVKEIAFLLYWEASAFYHYKKGEFNKILNDISALNLYWSFFRNKAHYVDLYYHILGKLYILLFQYRRAAIFLIESYKLKPTPEKLLDLIFAVELTYYNELRPYYNFQIIKKLLDKVDERKLNIFQKALLEFEKGFYYLLIKKYDLAYNFFKKSFNLDRAFLTDGQANYFIGRALEGLGRLKQAYFYYKLALKKVKHPIYKLRTLFRLFIVSAKLGYYQEANDYLYGIATLGGLQVNPYLQEALLKIPQLDDFINHFYWNYEYPAILAQIMWLNFNNERGKRAFFYLLEDFLNKGKPFPDFVEAWKLYYPHEVQNLKVDPKKVLNLPFASLKYLVELYKLNKPLFELFFGNYGYLALAKYYFYTGDWEKAKEFLKLVRVKKPIRYFIEGVIQAYKGNPYLLEIYYNQFGKELKTEALFWLGWGYLLNDRWDLTSLYWDQFLTNSQGEDRFSLQRIFSAYYLGLHLLEKGFANQGTKYLKEALRELSKYPNFLGLKRFIVLKLVEVEGYNSTVSFLKKLNLPDKEWQKFLKYSFSSGAKK